VGDIVAEGGEGVATADDRCWEAVESAGVVDPEAIANFGLPMFVGFRCFVLVHPRNRV
jgi:hypothetical protein